MQTVLSAVAGLIGGLALGWALAYMTHVPSNPYGDWLGKTCWVRPSGRVVWSEHVIVAVSWRGAVCVREIDRLHEDSYWIKKQNVRWRVRWERPREGEQ